MSYTMHSPSQGYTNASADVYASRAYGSHLMAQNYTAYLNRDDPYTGSPTGHYPSGPGLQSTHYGASGSSMPQQTYPTLPPISHFPHQQDLYSSCVAPSPRNHSYPSAAIPVSANMATSLPRHALPPKAYWDSVQQQQQQAQSNCYSSSNASINSAHKTSPQAWSHSPNVLSSPSSTPSPIPCPSTPHHFAASSPHHSQSHADSHKAYNGIISNSSLPNSNNNGNVGANLNCSTSSNSNPLQSLQKMVQIESENNEIRVQYETSVVIGSVGQHPGGQPNAQVVPLESDPNYPTYYNLDQNRMCATPQSGYSSIPAQSINSAPFSPTIKNTPELRPQSHQSNCSKADTGSENGDLTAGTSRTSSVRYPGKLSKEGSFLNNRSCSTDTVCSNGSPPSAQSIGKASSITEPVLQPEQTHDSVNSRSETTANSRDSVKSTDSDAMSSYATSQCPTPNNSSNWKLSTAVTAASDSFRPTNFPSNVQSKSWWPDSAISPSASRSFTPHLPDCVAPFGSSSANYPTSQVAHGGPLISQPNTNGAIASGQPWSQSSTPPSAGATPQMLPGASFTAADGVVVVKKKRGRPFGSKNRRNLENPQNSEVTKRKRKSVLVDIGVNTTLSFDVQASLNLDDSLAFESSVKHSVPLVMKRKKFIGPVVRIESKVNGCSLGGQVKYSVVNGAKFADEDPKSLRMPPTKAAVDALCSTTRRNGLSRKGNNLLSSSNANSSLHSKDWICVLCHKGPHYKGLGDLYGPYCIQVDRAKLSSVPSTEGDTHEVAHEEAAAEPAVEHSTERRSLRRRVDSTNSEESKAAKQGTAVSATSATKDDDAKAEHCNGPVSLEAWIHEDCIVWSNNVYLDGTTIRNLEPAIVESFGSICTKCKLPGATLGCIFKNCNVSPLHYLCAKDKDCDLDEEKFILSCSKHKKRRIASKEQGVVEVSEATTTAATRGEH